MALATISCVRIDGIAAAVPKNCVSNFDLELLAPDDRKKIVDTTGIVHRRISAPDQCASDLCQAAARKLLENARVQPSEIDALILVTQSPDYYFVPTTSAILQNRLGLPKTCLSFDLTLGCSGYTYGLHVLSSLISAGKIRRGLLLAGDTPSKSVSPRDKSTVPIFGDAGSATLLSYDESAAPMHFELGTDGSGSHAIRVEGGGFRHPFGPDSLTPHTFEEGIVRNPIQLALDGVEVFNFSTREVPQTIQTLLSHRKVDPQSIDLFLFHQANRLMNEHIRKKLKIPAEKVPYSLAKYGNTSSASIPVTLVSECAPRLREKTSSVLACGFGVGLSWATALLQLGPLHCPEIVEI